MDLLLNRLARRKDIVARDEFRTGAGDKGVDNGTPSMNKTEHLDADELNAYAENALLPAARARYSAHLADCETCRKLATDLVLAGGVAGVLEKSAATSPDISNEKSWWQSFAALFTLPSVRYGVPALALLAIISVAFIVTRQRQESTLVAQNKEQAPAAAVNQDAEESHSQTPSGAATTNTTPNNAKTPGETLNQASEANNNTDQYSARPQEKIAANPVKGVVAPKEETPLASTRTEVAQDSPPIAGPPASSSKASDALAQPDNAATPKADKDVPAKSGEVAATEPPPPQNNYVLEEERKAASGGAAAATQQQQQLNRDRGRDMAINRGDEDNLASDDKQKTMSKHAPPAPASVARRRAGTRAKAESRTESNTARESATADESAGAERNVAGRTFRRRGNAWIDTAYSSSRATVNVSRGSEQYRALLADEPSLRTIAEQLDGEVVVVWKGRAYRIH
jgi:hypothetical protein